ncbi:hypothetical protein BU17DRAFT_92947 [Hysterangium stoloniferum]|nr:hypothetical protein BU17DRAFT_92947 [Hysterangium stoloniferum]
MSTTTATSTSTWWPRPPTTTVMTPMIDSQSSKSLPSSNPSSFSPSTSKSRFNLAAVIGFRSRSLKHQHAVEIQVQDPPHRSRYDRDAPNSSLNPRFSKGASSKSTISRASTDGPLTPADDHRASSQHSLMTLTDTADPFAVPSAHALFPASSKDHHHLPHPFSAVSVLTPPAVDRRLSANSERSIGRRIRDRIGGGDNPKGKQVHLPIGNQVHLPGQVGRNSRERSMTMPGRVRTSDAADSHSRTHLPLPIRPTTATQARSPTATVLPTLPPSSSMSSHRPSPSLIRPSNEHMPASLLDAHADYAHERSESTSTGASMAMGTSPAGRGVNAGKLPPSGHPLRGSVSTIASNHPPLPTIAQQRNLSAQSQRISQLTTSSLPTPQLQHSFLPVAPSQRTSNASSLPLPGSQRASLLHPSQRTSVNSIPPTQRSSQMSSLQSPTPPTSSTSSAWPSPSLFPRPPPMGGLPLPPVEEFTQVQSVSVGPAGLSSSPAHVRILSPPGGALLPPPKGDLPPTPPELEMQNQIRAARMSASSASTSRHSPSREPSSASLSNSNRRNPSPTSSSHRSSKSKLDSSISPNATLSPNSDANTTPQQTPALHLTPSASLLYVPSSSTSTSSRNRPASTLGQRNHSSSSLSTLSFTSGLSPGGMDGGAASGSEGGRGEPGKGFGWINGSAGDSGRAAGAYPSIVNEVVPEMTEDTIDLVHALTGNGHGNENASLFDETMPPPPPLPDRERERDPTHRGANSLKVKRRPLPNPPTSPPPRPPLPPPTTTTTSSPASSVTSVLRKQRSFHHTSSNVVQHMLRHSSSYDPSAGMGVNGTSSGSAEGMRRSLKSQGSMLRSSSSSIAMRTPPTSPPPSTPQSKAGKERKEKGWEGGREKREAGPSSRKEEKERDRERSPHGTPTATPRKKLFGRHSERERRPEEPFPEFEHDPASMLTAEPEPSSWFDDSNNTSPNSILLMPSTPTLADHHPSTSSTQPQAQAQGHGQAQPLDVAHHIVPPAELLRLGMAWERESGRMSKSSFSKPAEHDAFTTSLSPPPRRRAPGGAAIGGMRRAMSSASHSGAGAGAGVERKGSNGARSMVVDRKPSFLNMGPGEERRRVALNIDGEWDDGRAWGKMRNGGGGGGGDKARVTFLDQQDRGSFFFEPEVGEADEPEGDSFLSFDLDRSESGRESIDSFMQ